jgi:hypothetical protein
LAGEAPAADKSRYHLFNPTPRELMREMSTDRPDVTESPYTVDAGHFQVEMDLVAFTYDRHNPQHIDQRVESWSFANTNLKIGLLNNVDLQLIVPAHNRIRTLEPDTSTRRSGIGDLTARLKVNLWGNDGGSTAFGIMPFVKFPTHQDELGNQAVEGGVILPLAVELPAGWSMGVMAEFDFLENEDAGRYHTEFVDSITFSHEIFGDLGGYVEFASTLSTEPHADWVATVDLGLTYKVTNDLQLDAGVNLGVTRAADDISPFVGISWRF